jgi:hypothetical protein
MIHAKASIRWNIDPRRIEATMKEALEQGWKECSELALADAKRRAPVGKGPGAGYLRDSIEVSTLSYTGFRLICRADYGIFIELGTKRHFIAPRKAKALHWEQGGKDRFSKGHYVSGIVAKPFIQPAMFINIPEYGEIHKKTMQEAFSQ